MDDDWGKPSTSLKVFISSPSDVDVERQAASIVIDRINAAVGERLGIFLRIQDWKHWRPSGGSPEEFIRRQLSDCDLFIMMFSRRFGSPPSAGSSYLSGTEMEYDIASRLREQSGTKKRPEIFVYFKEIADEALLKDPGPELAKVLSFQDRIRSTRFFKTYPSTEIFQYQLKDHLVEWLLEVSESLQSRDPKRDGLRRFFSLGTSAASATPIALLVYPKSEQRISDETHLLPYVGVEDFQAIHKVTKCLNIAGYTEVKAVTTDQFDSQRERDKNTVYFCLPRNRPAQLALAAIPDARFRFVAEQVGTQLVRSILWKNPAGQEIKVRSPQSSYLHAQRSATGGAWQDKPGLCVSVDFGILAAFPSPYARRYREARGLRDFFVFGIRGLGTWGAAWYLDRCILELEPKISGPVTQVLLRITYRDYRIREVRDVSECDQAYFDNENSPDAIAEELLRHDTSITPVAGRNNTSGGDHIAIVGRDNITAGGHVIQAGPGAVVNIGTPPALSSPGASAESLRVGLRADLAEVVRVLLARIDMSDRTVIFAILTRLDESQLATVKALEAALDANEIPGNEIQAAITALQATLAEVAQKQATLDRTLVEQARQAEEIISAPQLNVTDRLKVTIPMIPLFLSYEGEINLESGVNLETVWKRLVAWLHRGP